MQWQIENLKLPETSMRDNPEFQEILNQLKMAESQNWQIDEESKTNLAISLSQFMFKNQFNENPVKPRFVPILTVDECLLEANRLRTGFRTGLQTGFRTDLRTGLRTALRTARGVEKSENVP